MSTEVNATAPTVRMTATTAVQITANAVTTETKPIDASSVNVSINVGVDRRDVSLRPGFSSLIERHKQVQLHSNANQGEREER